VYAVRKNAQHKVEVKEMTELNFRIGRYSCYSGKGY